MPGDRISLVGVGGFGFHGVLPEEREKGQPFITDVELSVDLTRAAATDDLSATVDYGSVARHVVNVVEGEPCQLIETVADRVAQKLLDEFPVVRSVRVTVHKPEAPVGVAIRDVSVTLERSR